MKNKLKVLAVLFFAGVLSGIAAADTVPEGFVKVPAGSITGTEKWKPSSIIFAPERRITIDSFYMCDHEVTQGEFEDVMGANPSKANTDGEDEKNPVNYVNWYTAIAYCNKLSLKDGLTPCYTVSCVSDWANLDYSSIPTAVDSTWDEAICDFSADGYRLPTEAEWEWAARGGEKYTYSGSDNAGEVAWYTYSINFSATNEVKAKKANAYGLYDMSGNVWEWCWDWQGRIDGSTGALGPQSTVTYHRIYRGGSWCSDLNQCTVSARIDNNPNYLNNTIGFRVVRSIVK